MKESKKVIGYVLKLAPYKENDNIVTIINEDGYFSFRARGVKKISSNNASSLLLLAKSSFLLTKNGDFWTLKEGTLLEDPPYQDDLNAMASLSFIAELSSRLIMEEEAKDCFPWLEKALNSIKEGFSSLTAALLIAAHFSILAGYGLDVDECVYCHSKKQINGVNYSDGGFVCKNEDAPGTKRMTPRMLNILRYCFKCPLENFARVSFENKECVELICDLSKNLDTFLGLKLKTISAIKACR